MRVLSNLGAFLAIASLGLAVATESGGGDSCGGDPTPTTTELPASCTYKPTQTIWATEGCDIGCDELWCIADAAVVLPCGCTTVQVQPTTTTMCPTMIGCVQCTTGWGIATITESCSSGTATATAVTM